MKTEVKIYDLKQLQVILHGTIHFMAPSNITDKDNYIASQSAQTMKTRFSSFERVSSTRIARYIVNAYGVQPMLKKNSAISWLRR